MWLALWECCIESNLPQRIIYILYIYIYNIYIYIYMQKFTPNCPSLVRTTFILNPFSDIGGTNLYVLFW